ncbi:dedicator of cytokinesis protein 7-like [Uloborus diversus]|uniref:dedicator of cytokinesis protein 7-like n=1 Tax=Uloborus diversus TaxID=327109 RepID=UPI002409F479|nr:dedicator of cytokinesis protein 7-like [Uloborus diversus]
METRQRAFAQKLKWQPNADIRQQISSMPSHHKQDISKHQLSQGKVSLSDVVEPLDFEEYLDQHRDQIECDPFRHMLDFPDDDLEICILPRKHRTLEHIVPDDEVGELNQQVKDCIRCYTADWIIINRRYQQYSSSFCSFERNLERQSLAKSVPKQEFEIDITLPSCDYKDDDTRLKQINEQPVQHPPLAEDEDTSDSSAPSSNRQSFQLADTPRGSWASSVFDLRNSQADPLIPSLFDHTPSDAMDYMNEIKRQENRIDSLFALYPPLDDEDCVERRLPGPIPSEHIGHRLIVKCLALKLDLEIEPIFGTMALYDAKEKRKVSENFYFDMNSEPLKRMLSGHICYQDVSTLSRSCIFQITNPSPDLFLVIKLEKVLQGDINECIEPYVKDDKNREKLKSNAVLTCDRLGKYRMPFAWTAIYLMNIINGVNNMDKDSGSDRDSISSNSLDRKTGNGFETLRKKTADTSTLSRASSLERRNTLDKRHSWCSDEMGTNLDNFRPVTLTVNSFFKQETDRLRDEDLFKFLLDLKRPSSVLKRLKCIPGVLKLDIAPCPEEPKYCLTPELARLHPYPDEKGRPTKEILELPVKEIYAPHYSYRNLLFLYPKDVNFTNRPGSARNITCKVQYMANEEIHSAMPIIFGKSSCPEFLTEAYTAITYHNRFPDFYDEIKIKLPAVFTEQHHLLFTFYHISCQKKIEQNPTETPIGYTWFPLFRDGRLQTGDFSLPVMMEVPPASYSFLTPFIQIPNTKWVDNHKGIFNISIHAVSSVFPKDSNVDRFLSICRMIEEGSMPNRIGENSLEQELKNSMLEITNSPDNSLESLVNFLPLVLNKLIYLLVRPPVVAGQTMNIGQAAFEAISMVVNSITSGLEQLNDRHSRNSLLVTYASYQCTVPHHTSSIYGSATSESNQIGLGYGTIGRHLSTPIHRSCFGRSNSNPDIVSYADADGEVSSILCRGLDRTASMRAAAVIQDNVLCAISLSQTRKVLHEELALQCVVSSGTSRELILRNAWFFFDLIIRSMIEHLAATNRLDIPRKMRFCAQFFDDITTLVTTVTSDIISRCHKEGDEKFTKNLNSSLAFFLCDLFSVVDRGYVFLLIKSYFKQMSAKISTLPDSIFLMSLKLDFMRIICSHEHFVTLNIPFGTPLSPSPATSPCPSVASSSSQCSLLSTGTLIEKGNFTELTTEFRQQHFLIGLVLSDLWAVLSMNNPMLQNKGINMVRNLFTSHDWDVRLTEADQKARVASLYLPLVGIVLDALPLLYDWQSSNVGHDAENESDYRLSHEVASAISTSSVPVKSSSKSYDIFQNHKQLKEDQTRHLLTCVLWVLKNVDKKVLRNWWSELKPRRLHQLLEIMYISISCFEYKGKKALLRCSQQHIQKTSDIKSRLEDVILGHSSARSEMMRRKDRNPPSPSPQSGDKLRWRKDQMIWKSSIDVVDRPKLDTEAVIQIESNLSSEVNMIVLDTLELIVQVACHTDMLQGVLSTVLKVLLHALGTNQSTTVLQNMFTTQRSLVYKFPELLFEEETEQCADLCLRLLRHCSSSISSVRSQASASLYLLMRQNFEIGNNFARVKMQVTMSLSSLVGTNRNFNEEYLRHSLKTILVYAEDDSELQATTFPEQVHDLVFNLHMILSDTVKMKEFQEDPEMLMDLMYRIAKGYQTSPDLRLTWLANMAQKHTERCNHVEAAHCYVHSAALVAEYLYMLEDRSYLPVGCVAFEKISPDVLDESAVSDDVVSPDEEGICTGKYFTENGLIGLLEQAANSFSLGGMYENVNEVYKILIPIAEAYRDYKSLALIHSKLHDAFVKIDQQVGKRVFGTYFRVGFYGSKFGDLDGEEFIYKEPYLTKLPEISHRLENFYVERFGAEFVEVIKDSNTVDRVKLNPDKAYIQITYVEPFFEDWQLRERVTHFDRNYNIKCFIYATPFTPDGRAHGDLHEQYKRKTILTTACSFPYVKTRIQVVERQQIVLTPIEVAIEDIKKKNQELAAATSQDPADPKILQMVLQGCIGTTVNQGPMEIAHVFLIDLVDGKKSPTALQHKLRLSFKDFLLKCNEALRKNRTLIGPEQKDYQRELERNYHRFMERLLPMIKLSNSSVAKLSRERHGSGDKGSKRKQ